MTQDEELGVNKKRSQKKKGAKQEASRTYSDLNAENKIKEMAEKTVRRKTDSRDVICLCFLATQCACVNHWSQNKVDRGHFGCCFGLKTVLTGQERKKIFIFLEIISKMPSTCCAVGCTNRKTEESSLHFYRIPPPSNPERRQKWIAAVGRKDWHELQINNIIFQHDSFIWNPMKEHSIRKKKRFERISKRREVKESTSSTSSTLQNENEFIDAVEPDFVDFKNLFELEKSKTNDLAAQLEKVRKEMKTVQADVDSKKKLIIQCHNDSIRLTQNNRNLKKKLKKLKSESFGYESIKSNPKKHLFYTGIIRDIFQLLFKHSKLPIISKKLQSEDHLLLVLMKLRLGIKNKDLAYRFKVAESVVSKILRTLLPVFSKFMLNNFFSWPEKEALRKNLPECFRKKYTRCVCIIDCTEIFTERPLGLNARAQTWSNYKNHNTIKYLVACSPTGAVTFMSGGWGGRVSDKEITVKCGFLDLIEHGDQVLADGGFTVMEEVATMGGILEIPSFTKGKSQLSGGEVDHSRQIANVRIHIERVIGRMRKFNILNTLIPLTQVDLLDDIMVCVAGLVNFQY
ncbi:uncharacterized protein LOC130642389 [Hydractinia symbiolongicarpus]|uniref:uncharacterized protein LOC130642389 n=1 Tax=Hydractinia symbiolongicarpus TaxID=13093 RepID=UPI00254CB308|nr:uncharacterized protein LOC130642389 [Hydractinia symbiolongicarpus]